MELSELDHPAALAALVELHQHLADHEGVDATLRRVAQAAHSVVAGCNTAAITIYDRGYRTAAMAGEAAQPLDDAQYDSDSGPCLEAHRTNRPVEVPDIARASRWPEFRQAALDMGVKRSLSLPLSVGTQRLGALNLYSRGDGPFGPEVSKLAETFAHRAAVANVIGVQRLQDLVAQLSEALNSRDLLGQAKGILMAQHRITADEAFEMLSARSQQLNMKVRDLAEDVVATGDLDAAGQHR